MKWCGTAVDCTRVCGAWMTCCSEAIDYCVSSLGAINSPVHTNAKGQLLLLQGGGLMITLCGCRGHTSGCTVQVDPFGNHQSIVVGGFVVIRRWYASLISVFNKISWLLSSEQGRKVKLHAARIHVSLCERARALGRHPSSEQFSCSLASSIGLAKQLRDRPIR